MKKLTSLFLIFIIVFSLFGCAKPTPVGDGGSDVPQSEPADLAQGKTIACCMSSIEHPVHRIVQYGFCTKADELGMNPIVSGLTEGSQQELIDKWNSDISTNNAVGALIWTGDDSCYEMMKELKQQGIYTVVPNFCHAYEFSNIIDINPYFNYRDYGAKMADYVVDVLNEKGITYGDIAVSQIGQNISNASNDAFRERISELQVNYNILDTVMLGGHISEAENKTTTRLMKNENIVAAVGFDALDAYAWVSGAENVGLTDLVIIGMGMEDGHIGLVEEGKIQGLVCPPYYESGVVSANELYQLINGKVIATEEAWNEKLNFGLAYLGGEGENDIQTYRDIYDAAQAYFER